MPRPNSGPKLNLRKQKGAQPIWEIVWYEQGRRRTRSTGTGCSSEAEKALAKHLAEKEAKTSQGDPKTRRIADVFTCYATEHAPTVAAPERIAYAIEALLGYWGNKVVDDISKQACRDYCHWRGVSPGTVRRELTTLRAAINHDFQEKRLTATAPVWLPDKPDSKERWLTRDEAARLLWAARNITKARHHLPLYILISLYTGARKEAVLQLQWSQVDMEQGTMDFHIPGTRRSKKRRARPPIPKPLMTFLRLANRRSEASGTVIEFQGKSVSDIKNSFATACKSAGLTDVTPHTLRHTAITWLVQMGVPLWEVSGYVGVSVDTIERVYGHHAPDYLENARRAMESSGKARKTGVLRIYNRRYNILYFLLTPCF